MGLQPMAPVITDEGTVVIPAFVRMTKNSAAPRRTGGMVDHGGGEGGAGGLGGRGMHSELLKAIACAAHRSTRPSGSFMTGTPPVLPRLGSADTGRAAPVTKPLLRPVTTLRIPL
mmetsp:Transcript_28512/g.65483  ORF Transcript_28512/g.65483 Transcript_28512/m.65483 type:complete len:115 (-) Transcript_28512:14-358(-)